VAANYPAGTEFSNTVPASTSTWALAVTGAQIVQVYTASVTVNWQALAASPSSSTSEGYILQAAVNSNFSGLLISSSTTDVNQSTLTLVTLNPATTYYFRVGSLNWSNAADFVTLGSTVTYYAKAWTGAVSTSWANRANWTPIGVPGAADDVIIHPNPPNQPILDTTDTIKSMTIAGSGVYGSTLTMQNPLTAIT